MDEKRFDNLAKVVARSSSRRRVLGAALAGALGSLRLRTTAADDDGPDIASAGNGGVATASANGGAVGIGDVNSGGNAGNAIGVGDTVGSVGVDGGDATNATGITVTADGGTGIADASGGDGNVAFVQEEPVNHPEPEECRDEGQSCDHNPECCGSLVCCDDHCRHQNDCDEDEDKDAVCPAGTATFCCQCRSAIGTPERCSLVAGTQEECFSRFCDSNQGDPTEILLARPGEGFTCEDPLCTRFTC